MFELIREVARDARVQLTVPGDAELRELSVSELAPAAWDVAEGTRIYSDGVPDLTHTRVKAGGAGARLFVASDARLRGVTIDLDGDHPALFVGANCTLQSVLLQAWGKHAVLAMGSATTWQSGWCLCLAGQELVIGDDCMMANDVVIRTYDGHGIFDRESRTRVNTPAAVVLESHVWIGRRSTVNKGTRVGAGAVVGSDSVATGRLEGSSVYAGVPARRVRRNIAWSRTKHWDDVPDELR